MNKRNRSLIGYLLAIMSVFLLAATLTGKVSVLADETSSAVSVGRTDYDYLTTNIYKNGNRIVYYSIDSRKTWNELEGEVKTDDQGKAYIEMDISWANPGADVKIYIKGDEVKTEQTFTLPKQNSSLKVKFDKVTGDFNITTDSGAENFYWRKLSDYSWHSVSMNKTDASYTAFLETVKGLRFKGAKLVFKTGQTEGTDANNMGERPGKEVSVSVSKFGTAPNIKLNVTKMTVNTKATMEYTEDINGAWKSCQKSMSIADIAPTAFYADGKNGSDVKIYFRNAQTDKKPASLISSIIIPGQTGGPEVAASGKDVSYGINSEKKKFEVKFLTASDTNQFEYCAVTPDKTFDLNKAKWKSIKKPKSVLFTEKAVPAGSVIYIRYKGTKENAKKSIELKLPSAYVTFTVTWPDNDTGGTATPTPTAAVTATPGPTAAATGTPGPTAEPSASPEASPTNGESGQPDGAGTEGLVLIPDTTS